MGHRKSQQRRVKAVNNAEPARVVAVGRGLVLEHAVAADVVGKVDGLFLFTLDEACRQHRRERKRHDQRNEHGKRRRQPEARHKSPDDALHKADRDKHRHQRQRRRQNRQSDLARAFDRGLVRAHALFLDKAKDVFEHDDGVVDDDTDHQREAEHRDRIERIAHRVHQRKGRDDRGRDGEAGDERRPEAPQKQENDDGREYRADDQMLLDSVERVFDKDRVVADDAHLKSGRQRLFDLGEAGLDLTRNGDRILAGLFRNDQRHGRHTVQAGLGTRFLGAVLDVAEVLDLDLIVTAGRDDDVVKLLGRFDLADGADAGFLLPLVEPTARKLHILDPQRA